MAALDTAKALLLGTATLSTEAPPKAESRSQYAQTDYTKGRASQFRQMMTTIYLFTASDFKTIVIPKTFFGLASSLAGTVLLQGTVPSAWSVVTRAPLVMLWIWTNLLPFAIDNQRQPLSILEDEVNKPWRPLPSGSISADDAKRLMFLFYVVALAVSITLGAVPSCIALMALGYSYNDLGGADYSCIMKNVINAGGYISFAFGATAVASLPASFNSIAIMWFGMIAMIVFTTVQMQDIPDQEGDSSRGRLTVPLVIGDRPARRTVAIGVVFWSLAAPFFWRLHLLAYAMPLTLGLIVSRRALCKCTVREDKWTFKLWNLWMVSIYLLPLTKSFGLSGY